MRRGETAVLTHDASFSEVELSGLALTARHAKGVTLDTVRLRDCDLSESRMEHLRIVDGELGGCNLANLQARGATFANVAIERGRLTGIDLAEATLKDVAFSDCRIDLASFRGARLQRVTFSDCVLAETDFLEARLESVRMHGCDLRNADLRGGGNFFRRSDPQIVAALQGETIIKTPSAIPRALTKRFIAPLASVNVLVQSKSFVGRGKHILVACNPHI